MSVSRSFDRILTQHDRIAELLAGDETALLSRQPARSGWSPAEHLEHLVVVDDYLARETLAALEKPPTTSGSPTLAGRAVLLLGWIPRGKGEAPKEVFPTGADLPGIRQQAAEARARIESLRPHLDAIARSPARQAHPSLGTFTLAQWLRFALVHDLHHLKIVRELMRSGRATAGAPRP